MTWEEAIKDYKIPREYHSVSLKQKTMLGDDIINLGVRWLKASRKPSLYMHGNPGCGKTYFSTALLRHLIEDGHRSIIFIKSDDLEKNLLDASLGNLFNDQGYKVYERELLEKYGEIPILFIDDLGTEKDTDRVRQQYGIIIDRRVSEQLPTVYTSNLDLEQIGKTLGDRVAARLQISYQLRFKDQDLRKKVELFPI